MKRIIGFFTYYLRKLIIGYFSVTLKLRKVKLLTDFITYDIMEV